MLVPAMSWSEMYTDWRRRIFFAPTSKLEAIAKFLMPANSMRYNGIWDSLDSLSVSNLIML